MERLRPIDIEKTLFKRVFRGYDPKAVEALTSKCSKEIEALLAEAQTLRSDNERMRAEVESFRAQENTLKEALMLAQRAADDTKAAAHRESELLIEEARRRAADLQRELESKLSDVRWNLEKARLEKDEFVVRFRNMLEDYLRAITETEPRLAVIDGDRADTANG